jgi:eukaryotic-like serine/threonine-protein kinase
MALQPGSVIGAYEITEPLGKGGMGEVYRARDTRLGRLVAIKFLPPHLQGNAAAAARLDREARLASSLNHPGIVTVFDVGRTDDQRPFVVMELIDGVSLGARLNDGRMRLREVIDLAVQVTEALAAAHEAGIVHRDLKPQNIMVTPEGRAKVVDFGLSKNLPTPAEADEPTMAIDRITGDYAVLGTAGYMAPEQILGHPVDARADQFALGAILYEMLTGRRAFRRDSSVQTMTSILEDEPLPIAEVRDDVPADAVAIVSRCLAKRPEGRYASTRDLAHDLRDVLEQIVLESRSQSRPRPRPAPARSWTVPLVASGALIVAALVGWLAWQRGSSAIEASEPGPAAFRQIVVLPLANVTKDPGDQVFADGLVETLTSSLTELERFQRTLRVVPASEVRGAKIATAKEARQSFGATLAISGSIQRLPSSVRLTLNLVDASALVQLSSRTIQFAVGEEALTQDTVVGAVTALLALQLEPEAQHALTAGGTRAATAYEAFVQGRGYLQRFDRGVENIDRAIALLTRAVEADPRYALAHTALGEALWRKYEFDRQAADIEQAVAHCEMALAIDNRLAPVHVTLAMIARGRGRYEEAVAVAQRAVELDPVSSDGYRELGRAYEELKRLPDAEATYRKAIDARPDDWLAYNTLGSFLLARSRLPEAEAAFKHVMALTPDNTRAYNNLGVTFFAMGRADDAASMWERSTAIRPSFAAASNLGAYYYARARYSDAARAFERAVSLSPNNRRLWRNLGAALYWAPGERRKAKDAYARAVELGEAERRVNPRQPSLLAELADSYSMLGQRAEALDAAAAVERLGSGDADAMFNVASAYEQTGDRDLALKWLDKATAAGYSREAIERSPGLAELRKDARYTAHTR